MAKKFFLIAGEASGDLLGSKLIKELKSQNPDSIFIGVGGRLMKEQGLTSIFSMEELSIMGIFEVIPHIAKLLRRIKQTAATIISEKPDVVITIDSPDFCFRVMKKLRNFKDVKKVHLIAPSVWAYREGRAKKIAAIYDLLLAILPFEPPYFEKYGLKTIFIGHPIMENAPDFSKKEAANLLFRRKHNIDQADKVICIMPGSRNGEVSKIFPEFIDSVNLLAQEMGDLKVIIPMIDKTRHIVTEMAKSLQVKYFLIEKDDKESAFFSSNFALAKSGTNTVELSLYHVPMIIAYKINILTHFFIKRMVKIKFANLVNLIKNQEIIPEMLQDKCDSKQIYPLLKNMIENNDVGEIQVLETIPSLKLMGLYSTENPSQKAAREILKNL